MIATLFSLCLLTAVPSQQAPGRVDSLHSFLRAVHRARPAGGARDAYKLLYQGAFGIGHMLPSRDGALHYLRAELAEMDTTVSDPLLEPCDPAGTIVRVNLRPFTARGLRVETLVDAMLASAAALRPDTAAFARQWDAVVALTRTGALPWSYREAQELAADLRKSGPLPVHHSPGYTSAYAPAYRVVLKAEFLRFFPGVRP